MELLLNLVWLLISAAIFAGLALSLRRERQRGFEEHASPYLRYISALVLVFILLPVISMTDDLHAMPMMAEGERAVRAQAADTSQQQHKMRVPVLFLAALVILQGQPHLLATAISDSFVPIAPLWKSPQTANRAPPALLS